MNEQNVGKFLKGEWIRLLGRGQLKQNGLRDSLDDSIVFIKQLRSNR